jgi:hypothetical protein
MPHAEIETSSCNEVRERESGQQLRSDQVGLLGCEDAVE